MAIERLRMPFLSKLNGDRQGSNDIVHSHPEPEHLHNPLHQSHSTHDSKSQARYSQIVPEDDETQTQKVNETLTSTESTTDEIPCYKNDDSGPAQPRRILRHRIRISWLDSWTREALSSVLAVASLASLIAVLAVYRNKPIQDIPSLISINTLVSVISSIMKAALIMPVAEGNQSKWLHFRTSRPLVDFDSVDQASRGPWGSLLMVWRMKSKYLVTFGAWITIAALAIDPFSQQVINYHPCEIDSNDAAFIAQTNNFTVPRDDNLTLFNNDLVLSLHGALMNTEQRPSVSFWCPTGNCTFNTDEKDVAFFETLAVQASCKDVTDLAILDEVGRDDQKSRYEWFLPEFRGKNKSIGYDSVAQSDISLRILPSNGSPRNQSASDEMSVPKLTILMLRRSESAQRKPEFKEWRQYGRFLQDVEPLAVECRFQGAVQSLNSEVRQNVLSERIVSSMVIDENADVTPLKPFHGHIARTWRRYGGQHQCSVPTGTEGWATDYVVHIVNGSIVDPSKPQNAMGGTWYRRGCLWPNSRLPWLQDYLNDIFGEQALRSGYLAAELDANLVDKWMSKLHSDGNANFTTAEIWAKTVATSLTTTIRNWASIPNGDVHNMGGGYSQRVVTCVGVQWAWGILPASLVPLAILFLTLTIRSAPDLKARGGPWKSSSLAVLFHGLDEEAREQCGEVRSMSGMTAKAETMQVKLADQKTGWRLTTAPRQNSGYVV